MAAQALGVGAGALLCAGPQALVCGAVGAALITAGMVGAWWMSSSSVENADDKAGTQLESGTAAATCATGNCDIPPKCKDITEEMRRVAAVVQQRFAEMAADVHGMAGGAKIPRKGDLKGHIKAIKQAQNRLRNAVDRAKNKGCPIPSDVQQWLDKEPPG